MKKILPLTNWANIPVVTKLLLGLFFLLGLGFFISPSESIIESDSKLAQVAENNIVDDLTLSEEKFFDEFDFYEVVSITDGDTIKVKIDDKIQTVRLVNMNTPESVDPRRPVECMGKEASEQMKQLVEGKKVTLEIDETQTDRDRYSRLLRFVFLEDGTDVGLQMIKLGFAYSTPYGSSPHKYLEAYEDTEAQAKESQLGLWDPEACVQPTAKSTLKPTQKPAQGVVQGTSTNLDPVSSAFSCDCSKTCPQMSSCEEAYYQLNVCGCSARDGDGDGVPCEIICPGG